MGGAVRGGLLGASGFGEALARVLGVPSSTVPPVPAGGLDPAPHWRGWLGGLGLGLVPVEAPGVFAWPGAWIAVLPGGGVGVASGGGDRGGDALVAAVAFGVPAGLLWVDGVGDVAVDDPRVPALATAMAGFVVAPLDAARFATAALDSGTTTVRGDGAARAADELGGIAGTAFASGTVCGIAIAPEATSVPTPVESVAAVAGRGLVGDRYHAAAGTFSAPGATGTALTFIDAAVLEAVPGPVGPVSLEASRRNIATRGVDLDALIGREFRVGEVVCLGRRRAEPCAHLDRLGPAGLLRALVHRGGLRADILTGGRIALGDAVELV